MPKTHRPTALLIAALVIGAGLGAHPAAATAAPADDITYTVNSTLDQIDNDLVDTICNTASNTCTLRAAIMQADNLPNTYATVTIILPAGIYLFTRQPTVDDGPDNGDLNLTAGVAVIRIQGAGAASTIIDAHQYDRVLSVDANRTAFISGITLRNGYTPRKKGSGGAGLNNSGALSLDSSVVAGNLSVTNYGGGIANFGVLTISTSTIGPNNSAPSGGGIFIDNGQVTLDRSTLYGNAAEFGAGIFNLTTGNLFILNSTLSRNIANITTVGNDGGAIYNLGTANVYNSTIAFNGAELNPDTSTAAGGVTSVDGGVFNIRNTLLAGNYHANDSSAADCTGAIHAYGRNLFSVQTPCTVDSPDAGSWAPINSFYLIGPLQNNGGPTWTHALLAGSNAIDAGDLSGGCLDQNSNPLPTDQRGAVRTLGAACDLGAFEFLPPAAFLPFVAR